MTVIGTRPEIIKMSPLIPLFEARFKHVLIHSGQHYSPNMDRVFFDELGLRSPDEVLACGGLPPAEQVGVLMQRLEKILLRISPDAVVVHGDTNTTLGAALTAAKHKERGMKLVHVEAGCRSGNRVQSEEVNRLLVDRISDLLFAPSDGDAENLIREGVDPGSIVVAGNTVVDSCRRMSERVREGEIARRFGAEPLGYALATLHRQETVDDAARLGGVLRALDAIAARLPVVFCLHPRTAGKIREFGLALGPGILAIEPVGYREMIGLMRDARFCLTDSGGLQEEAAVLRTPTLVLRRETEYMRYVEAGVLKLVGTGTEAILAAAGPFLRDAGERERIRALPIELPADAAPVIADRLAAFLG